MSTHIDATGSDSAQKKRKIQRACDACRRKKIRCYGISGEGSKCANCISYNEECSYNDLAKTRYSSREYVDLLEERVRNMEALLQKVSPTTNLAQELQNILVENPLKPSPAQLSVSDAPDDSRGEMPEDGQYLSSDEEDPVNRDLSASLQKLEINQAFPRFLGKSSAATLVKAAMKMKSDVMGAETPSLPTIVKRIHGQRPEIFRTYPWEQKEHETAAAVRLQQYIFPEPDLLSRLIDCYFRELNIIYPILHRPSFERHIRESLHVRDDGFAKVLLVVCSIGARFVDDPRVNINGGSAHSAGWKWYNQVQLVRQTFQGVRLYEVQLYAFAAMFMISSSTPHAGWSLAGTGLRLALEVGAHRRKMYSSKDPLSSELWKRVFCVLVCLDRNFSMILGQPCSIHDEDFDLGLPMIVDDKHWEHPENLPSLPSVAADLSQMAGFVCLIKLYQILAFALRTIYSINKSKALYGFTGPEWEQKVVSDLDSALNKWNDTIPDLLRWGHPNQDDTSFHISASLYLTYHQIQINVHRPFIPTLNRQSTLASSALAICTSAARSISRILDAHFKRRQHALPIQLPAASMAGMTLFLSIWGGIRAGVTSNSQKAMEDVNRCMDYLKHCEPHWHIAGRGYMILHEILTASDAPVPTSQPETSMKRRHDEMEDPNMEYNELSLPSSQYAGSVSSFDSTPYRTTNQPHQVQADWPSIGPLNVYAAEPLHPQQSWQPSYDVPPGVQSTPSTMPNDIVSDLSQIDSAGWTTGIGSTNPFDHMFDELFQTTPPSDHASPATSNIFNELDEILYSGSLANSRNYQPPPAQAYGVHQMPWTGGTNTAI